MYPEAGWAFSILRRDLDLALLLLDSVSYRKLTISRQSTPRRCMEMLPIDYEAGFHVEA